MIQINFNTLFTKVLAKIIIMESLNQKQITFIFLKMFAVFKTQRLDLMDSIQILF